MFTIFIIFYTLTRKTIGCVCRGIKTIPKPQEFYRAPGSEIPGSVTEIDMIPFISYDNGMFLTTVAKYVYMYMYILIINVKTTK